MESSIPPEPEPTTPYSPEPGALQDGHWFWLENEATERVGRELGVHALGVYTVLARCANSTTRQCWPSYGTIADDLNCHPSTVAKAVAQLEAHGFIRVQQRFKERVRVRRRRRVDRAEVGSEPRLEHDTHMYTIVDRLSVALSRENSRLEHEGVADENDHPSRFDGELSSLESATVAATAGNDPRCDRSPFPPQPAVTRRTDQDDLNETKHTRRREVDHTSTPTAAGAAMGQGPKEQRRERREELARAFLEAQGEDPKDYANRTLYDIGRVLAGLPEKFTADDVRDCTAYLLTFPHFMEPGALTVARVAATVPRWVNEGRPEYRACDNPPPEVVARWDYERSTERLTDLEIKGDDEGLTAEEEQERQYLIENLAWLRSQGYDFRDTTSPPSDGLIDLERARELREGQEGAPVLVNDDDFEQSGNPARFGT